MVIAFTAYFCEGLALNDTVVRNEQKVIHLINGRCGGNKTGYIVKKIALALSENPHQCIIYAAPTIDALSEVFSERMENIDTASKQMIISDKKVNNTEKVNSRITSVLKSGYCGCLLITHAALFNLDKELFVDKWVIIDESPEDTVRFFHFERYIDKTTPYFEMFEKLVISTPVEKVKNCIQIIAGNTENRIALIKKGFWFKHQAKILKKSGQSDVSRELYNLSKLCFITASEHGYAYRSKINTGKKSTFIYRTIEIGSLMNIVNSASEIWISSADFEGGLLHFLLTNYHRLSIQKIKNTGIPLVHEKANVTIIPLLSDKKQWSKNFAKEHCSLLERFNFKDGYNNLNERTVFSELFDFGVKYIQSIILKNNENQQTYLMFVNNDDKNKCNEDKFIQASTKSHGQNSYLMNNHAIWLASLRANPDENNALVYFCRQQGIDHQAAKNCLQFTRQYANLYQGLARTSLRDETSIESNLFIVPDTASAKALLRWIPNATIDTTYVFTLKELTTKKQESDEEKLLTIEMFKEVKNAKHGKKIEIYRKYGVNDTKKAFRLKEKYKEVLREKGLYPEDNDKHLFCQAHGLIQYAGYSMRKACDTVGLDKSKYLRILKKKNKI